MIKILSFNFNILEIFRIKDKFSLFPADKKYLFFIWSNILLVLKLSIFMIFCFKFILLIFLLINWSFFFTNATESLDCEINSLNFALIYFFRFLCLSIWSGVIFRITEYFDLNIWLYSNWYDEASITNIVFLVIFFSDKAGFPILPINLESYFWSNKTSCKILEVVDLPLVPVIVTLLFL